jgi:gamma-glutamylputrescine oxidase
MPPEAMSDQQPPPFEDPTPPRPSLASEVDVDVCIVGGGLAGLSIARELALRRWSSVVLDAGRIGAGASAHNAGVVAPGFTERMDVVIERVGRDRARALWGLSLAGAERVRKFAGEPSRAVPALALAEGRLSVSRQRDRDATARYAACLNDAFGYAAEHWPEARVAESLTSDRVFDAVYWPSAFCISSAEYARKLAAATEMLGVRIFERSPVTSIDVSGVRKRVSTASGRVRAQHIVLATGAQATNFDSLLAGTVMPLTQELVLTGPIGAPLHEAIRFAGAIDNPHRLGELHRVVDGGRLLMALPLRLSGRREARVIRHARRTIETLYPALKNVRVDQVWTNTVGFPVHRMPQIGELSNGLWLATGFATQGLNTTAMAGELIAGAIAEGDDRWRLLSGYGLVWTGGRFGRTVVAGAMVAGSVRRRAAEAFARWRRAAGRSRIAAAAPAPDRTAAAE